MLSNFFKKLPPEPGPPESFPIAHDDYHASGIGTLRDGGQYFITTGFVWEGEFDAGGRRRDFAVLYLFNADGSLREADIREFAGQWSAGGEGGEGGGGGDDDAAVAALFAGFEKRLASMGGTPGDIVVKPFRLERFGTEFGLIPRPPEEEGDEWRVTLEPGDCMVFFPPWDGGYDT